MSPPLPAAWQIPPWNAKAPVPCYKWQLVLWLAEQHDIHFFREPPMDYLVEQEYRFNTREGKDGGRFIGAVVQTPGKRLTYKELVGRED